MNDGELDELIRKAALAETVDASAVERRVRSRLRSRRWLWIAGGAAVAAAAAVATFAARVPQSFRDAARDHRVEVVEKHPRRWKTGTDLECVARQYPIEVPAGFRLLEAKRCGIAGKAAMHLVYTDGAQQVSVYVTTSAESGDRSIDGEQVKAFTKGKTTGLIVGPASECSHFADVIQRST